MKMQSRKVKMMMLSVLMFMGLMAPIQNASCGLIIGTFGGKFFTAFLITGMGSYLLFDAGKNDTKFSNKAFIGAAAILLDAKQTNKFRYDLINSGCLPKDFNPRLLRLGPTFQTKDGSIAVTVNDEKTEKALRGCE